VSGRHAPGQVLERKRGREVVFAIRFRAYGRRHYESVGRRSEGCTRRDAEERLKDVLAQVRLGTWQPPRKVLPPARAAEPTFHEFASEWLEGRRADGLSERSIEDLKWSLQVHLLPWFANMKLADIGVEDVDRFRRAKVREGRLSASSINKCLKHLAGVLEEAIEYGHLEGRNPAKGKRRRLKAPRSRRVHLDRAEWIAALLDAAGELDARARCNRDRRALLATLLFAGLRISEALALRWRDVDLAAGRLRVRDSKTDAGARYTPLLPVLRELLAEHKATVGGEPGQPVFARRDGEARDRNAVRTRMLHPAIELANERLEAAGSTPLPEGLTCHGLRHTYVSLRLAIGADIATVARDAGHADAVITAKVYTHAMALGDDERAALKALVDGVDWAPVGTKPENGLPAASDGQPGFGSTMQAGAVSSVG
jgi:integrase